jgi:hypothetical protein
MAPGRVQGAAINAEAVRAYAAGRVRHAVAPPADLADTTPPSPLPSTPSLYLNDKNRGGD